MLITKAPTLRLLGATQRVELILKFFGPEAPKLPARRIPKPFLAVAL